MFNKTNRIMKKFILVLAAVLMAAGMASAQDLATATTTYNNGAEALQLDDKAGALKNFQQALTMGQALGEEGAELVANCKKIIPGVILSMGKELYNAKDFAGALGKFQEAQKIAKEYAVEEVEIEAADLIGQVGIVKDMEDAKAAMKANDLAKAADGFKKVLAADSTNAAASFMLVQVLAAGGNMDAAKEALVRAEANGQGENAKKVIGTSYLKQAAAALKAQKYADAVKAAVESDVYGDNPQAFLVAGQASQKMNKTADAIKYFEKYLEAAPTAKNAGPIALTVGALYQGQKNNAKALEFYKKAQAAGTDAKQYIDALSK